MSPLPPDSEHNICYYNHMYYIGVYNHRYYNVLRLARSSAARQIPLRRIIGPPAHYLPCKRRRVKAPPFAGNWTPKCIRLDTADSWPCRCFFCLCPFVTPCVDRSAGHSVRTKRKDELLSLIIYYLIWDVIHHIVIYCIVVSCHILCHLIYNRYYCHLSYDGIEAII